MKMMLSYPGFFLVISVSTLWVTELRSEWQAVCVPSSLFGTSIQSKQCALPPTPTTSVLTAFAFFFLLFVCLFLREGDNKDYNNLVSTAETQWLLVTLDFSESHFFSLWQCLQLLSLPVCLPLSSPSVSFPHITSASPCSSFMSSLYQEMRLKKEQRVSGEYHRAELDLKWFFGLFKIANR